MPYAEDPRARRRAHRPDRDPWGLGASGASYFGWHGFEEMTE